MNQTKQRTKIEITREQVSELLRDFPAAGDDARLWVMRDLADEHEAYTKKLKSLSRDLAREVERNEELGIPTVSECVLRTSLIDDIATHAAKITALLRVLEVTCKAKNDPNATAVDELIRTLDWRS